MTDMNEAKIKEQVAARCKAEEESFLKNANKEDGQVTSSFVNDCLSASERGDGALFAVLHKGKYIFNKTSSQWYRWKGHHWDLDVLEEAHGDVEKVCIEYDKEADALIDKIIDAKSEEHDGKVKKLEKKENEFYRTIKRLRTVKGASNCLTWSHRVEEGLSIRGERLDRQDWLLAAQNGVVELKTGKFRAGRPEDYISKGVPHKWIDINCSAPTWETFLHDVFNGNVELIAYVQRLFGYGITGLATEHILPVLHGDGRNGKGTLVETLRYVLGPLAQPIQSEMLLEHKTLTMTFRYAHLAPAHKVKAVEILDGAINKESNAEGDKKAGVGNGL